MSLKPLGAKAYGSIPHLPGSRVGPGDYHSPEGQARICTIKARDKEDLIIVQEKLDGSCVAVARLENQLLPLVRRGYLARTSPFEMHHWFADWVEQNASRFLAVLNEGERVCGEWLAQAHGTRYALPHEPFVAFDLMMDKTRTCYSEFRERLSKAEFVLPGLVHIGVPLTIEAALAKLETSFHGALDPVEGAVWRVERNHNVEFLAKYVRPDKSDGCYLPDIAGTAPIWNRRPADL